MRHLPGDGGGAERLARDGHAGGRALSAEGRKPGSQGDICRELWVVQKGWLVRGPRGREPYRLKGEDPVHKVTIAKPFAVGRFTISFDEWDSCLADGGCNGEKGNDPRS